MASPLIAALAALAAWLFYATLGAPLARRLGDAQGPLPGAALLGFAVHSAIALPLFSLIGFSRAAVVAVAALSLLAALAALWRGRGDHEAGPRVPVLAIALALILSAIVAAAVLPKTIGDAVVLSGPIFDHSKIAMIDEMVRSGVPPANPFFGGESGPRLSYYYLWHFAAAQLALVLGISGWEADAALTGFTAFAALSLMMTLAVRFSGRRWAALVAVALAATASFRLPLEAAFGKLPVETVLHWATGFGGWFVQFTWAPQHGASAALVVVATLLLVRLARAPSPLGIVILALLAVAAFECSAYVGGIAWPLAAFSAGIVLLVQPETQRLRFVGAAVAAAALALAIAAPFALEQAAATAARGASPLAVRAFPVFAETIAQPWRTLLDLPGYWLILLPLEWPAFFIVGVAGLVAAWRRADPPTRPMCAALIALVTACLVVGWLLASVIGENNDLGWRAVLPAILVLIPAAAAALTRWIGERRWQFAAPALGLALLGVPEGILFARSGLTASVGEQSAAFARAPALWEAVRRHTPRDARVLNNPAAFEHVTPWPANIGWALMADRRSCFAGGHLTLPFLVRPLAEREAQSQAIDRVFAGAATSDDLQLVQKLDCRVIVMTPDDGAWARDPFATLPDYEKVEETAGWRIWRRK